MDLIWDCVTRAATLRAEAAQLRHTLATTAKAYDWPQVLVVLGQHPDLINTTRPDGRSWYTVLHQAAHGGAPVDVVQRLLDLGAWRSMPTAQGGRARDIAQRQGSHHLLDILEPVYQHQLPLAAIAQIQTHLHAVIRERAAGLVDDHHLRLPEVLPLLELAVPKLWMPIPGMHGGFRLHLDPTAPEPLLVAESWCRVVDGSGQRHHITAHGSDLVAEGFV